MSQEEKERKRGRRATLTRDSRNSTYKRRLNRLAQSGPVLYPPIRPPCEGWDSARSPGKGKEDGDRQTVVSKRAARRTSQNAEADNVDWPSRHAVRDCTGYGWALKSLPHCDALSHSVTTITSRFCEKNARLSPKGHPSLARHIRIHYYNMELIPEGAHRTT